MRAITKSRPTLPGIEVVEIDAPRLERDDDVVVRVLVSSISGSEVNIWRGSYRRPSGEPVEPGRILGYEHAGVVEEAGPAAKELGFLPGRPVALASPFIGCRRCEPCQQGYVNRCRDWGHIGITVDGTDAELARLPAEVLQPLNGEISMLDAVFLNTAALAVRAIRLAQLIPGDRAIVVGPGPVGLLMVQVARLAGASWIGLIGLDRDTRRLEIGLSFGADATFLNSDIVAEEVREVTDGQGAEVVLEAAGTAQGLSTAVDTVRVGGTVATAGLPPERNATIEAIRVTRDEVSIRGVEGNLPDDRRRALRLLERGLLTPRNLVTRSFPVDRAEEAFAAASSGEECKATFLFSDSMVATD